MAGIKRRNFVLGMAEAIPGAKKWKKCYVFDSCETFPPNSEIAFMRETALTAFGRKAKAGRITEMSDLNLNIDYNPEKKTYIVAFSCHMR